MGLRLILGLAAALVGLLAVLSRPGSESAVETRRPEARIAPPAQPGMAAALPTSATPLPEPRPALLPEAPLLVQPKAEPSAMRAPTPRNLAGILERELGLGALQAGRVEEIFRRREVEVAAVQAQVLASGVFDPRAVDPRLAELRAQSYRQISMLLDAAQDRRFAEILATNRINDYMAIRVPEHLVTVD